MQVRNMKSSKGNTIANQFVIDDDNGNTYFQSYNSIIAKVNFDGIFLDKTYWNYSVTTSKYLNKFLSLSSKEVKNKIKCNLFKLENLNEGVSYDRLQEDRNSWRS
tara:strand:+ start:194 stop:508 length:315 start_codon:yes stop_codon:yes gene_type:complete